MLRSRLVVFALLFALSLLAPTVAATPSFLVLSYHDIRDDVAVRGDPDQFAISTQNFAAHLDWLAGNGYTSIGIDDLLAARDGRRPLPDRAVMITIDDGLRSVYTHAYPLLQAYGFRAVSAVVTAWVDLPEGESVDYGPRPFTREDFLTWEQVREMHGSGVVEIASHSHDMHYGVLANPQGNLIPAAITHIWDADAGRYETRAEHLARIEADLATSAQLIEQATGQRPQAVVWPFAAYTRHANAIATRLGMPVSFDLEGPNATLDEGLHGLERLLILDNPTVKELAFELRRVRETTRLRAVQVDLDYIYDDDPEQIERNLDTLIERLNRLRPSHVFLQAFADPDGDDAADALYFPNRHLPMRADLFNRVAWQIRTRAQAQVHAWLPVLAFIPPDPAVRERLALPDPEPGEVFRLDPTNPEARRLIAEIYEDLAIASPVAGIHFHDDAMLRETELPGLYPGDPAARSRYLIAFTHELQSAAEQWRPKLRTSRNLFARPVLEPESQAWFAQSLESFIPAYDYTVIMAMPWMEGEAAPDAWLDRLARAALSHPGARDRVALQLQTVDWRTRSDRPALHLPEKMRRIQAAGIRHIAYYPDDFIRDHPPLERAREAVSARVFPYEER